MKSAKVMLHEIGYCKPPANTRFQPGVSGNPKGRPKGSLGLATVFGRILRERVTITENGRRKSITKLEAAAKQITNKAAGGDLASLKALFTLVQNLDASHDDVLEKGSEDTKVVSFPVLSPEENDRRINELLAKAGMRLVPLEESTPRS